MPFKSKAQQGYMFANHPRIAKKMADRQKKKQGKNSLKNLPKRVKSKRSKKK